eukprot:Platyproteum_vivax@DN6010_c0_g1_i2.p1
MKLLSETTTVFVFSRLFYFITLLLIWNNNEGVEATTLRRTGGTGLGKNFIQMLSSFGTESASKMSAENALASAIRSAAGDGGTTFFDACYKANYPDANSDNGIWLKRKDIFACSGMQTLSKPFDIDRNGVVEEYEVQFLAELADVNGDMVLDRAETIPLDLFLSLDSSPANGEVDEMEFRKLFSGETTVLQSKFRLNSEDSPKFFLRSNFDRGCALQLHKFIPLYWFLALAEEGGVNKYAVRADSLPKSSELNANSWKALTFLNTDDNAEVQEKIAVADWTSKMGSGILLDRWANLFLPKKDYYDLPDVFAAFFARAMYAASLNFEDSAKNKVSWRSTSGECLDPETQSQQPCAQVMARARFILEKTGEDEVAMEWPAVEITAIPRNLFIAYATKAAKAKPAIYASDLQRLFATEPFLLSNLSKAYVEKPLSTEKSGLVRRKSFKEIVLMESAGVSYVDEV